MPVSHVRRDERANGAGPQAGSPGRGEFIKAAVSAVPPGPGCPARGHGTAGQSVPTLRGVVVRTTLDVSANCRDGC